MCYFGFISLQQVRTSNCNLHGERLKRSRKRLLITLVVLNKASKPVRFFCRRASVPPRTVSGFAELLLVDMLRPTSTDRSSNGTSPGGLKPVLYCSITNWESYGPTHATLYIRCMAVSATYSNTTNTHTHTHLTALFPGQPM